MNSVTGRAKLLEVDDLAISVEIETGRRTITTPMSFSLDTGETLAIVGESGSGKSLTARAIAGILPQGVTATGAIRLAGDDLSGFEERQWQQVRGRRISMLLQDPFTMLNPVMRCGAHIEEMLGDDRRFSSRKARRTEVLRRLAEVGIDDPAVADQMPFQLSGGMSQRVALAAALARDPELLIADEPSTALDVTTQAEIIALLRRAQKSRGMALILITHDLRLAFSACERIGVLYAGALIETGRTRTIQPAPAHPYTLGLLLSEPPADRKLSALTAIPGRVPAAHTVENQCTFADRCQWVMPQCRVGRPLLRPRAGGRMTACRRQPDIQAELDAMRQDALTQQSDPELSPSGDALVRLTGVSKVFGGKRQKQALKEVSLAIAPGESVGLVGESGSGKTTLGRCIVGLETPSSGRIEIGGLNTSDFGALTKANRAQLRRTVQMVFQDPYSTLNPRHSVGRTLKESLRVAGRTDDMDRAMGDLLEEVGLTSDYARRRPAELSGGERQRIAIARALAVDPKLLVCDEPVSALDVSVQAQVLNLLKRLQKERSLALLFITHDLSVVRQVADRICVLYLGEIVERGEAASVMDAPRHAYTQKLLGAMPGRQETMDAI